MAVAPGPTPSASVDVTVCPVAKWLSRHSSRCRVLAVIRSLGSTLLVHILMKAASGNE